MPKPKSKQPEQARIPPAPPEAPAENGEPRQSGDDSQRSSSGLEKIGALWKRKSKRTGMMYLSGVCHDERIMIFPIKEEYRKNEKAPQYQIMRQKLNDEDIPF